MGSKWLVSCTLHRISALKEAVFERSPGPYHLSIAGLGAPSFVSHAWAEADYFLLVFIVFSYRNPKIPLHLLFLLLPSGATRHIDCNCSAWKNHEWKRKVKKKKRLFLKIHDSFIPFLCLASWNYVDYFDTHCQRIWNILFIISSKFVIKLRSGKHF